MIADDRTRSHMWGVATEASLSPIHSSLVNRPAPQCFCHVQELLLGRAATELDPQPHNENPRVSVAGIPTSNRDCRHQVYVESGAQLEKLDLVATRRAEVRQRFHAETGDQLSFDCLVWLKSGRGFSPAAHVSAVVVNLELQTAETLLDRTVDGDHNSGQRRIGSNSRESRSLPIVAAGEYELRTITSIDPTCPGAEAHLLIDSVRVTDALGSEARCMASLCCVGRVTP